MATIGNVKDKDRRATKQEEPFVGLSRENIQSRFDSPISIPTKGPTVPEDSTPKIISSPATEKPRANSDDAEAFVFPEDRPVDIESLKKRRLNQ